jgi:hypothetical protein
MSNTIAQATAAQTTSRPNIARGPRSIAMPLCNQSQRREPRLVSTVNVVLARHYYELRYLGVHALDPFIFWIQSGAQSVREAPHTLWARHAITGSSQAFILTAASYRRWAMRIPMREGDPCPMCATPMRTVRCGHCHGAGTLGLIKHRCGNCGGTGKLVGCPNYFAHPGLGAPTENDGAPSTGWT